MTRYSLPPLPEGAKVMTADEAVEAIVTSDHPGADKGGVELDAGLVEAVRAGKIVAIRLADRQLAFTRVED